MGQKVNPIGLRVAVNRNWDSRWYSDAKGFGGLLHEDLAVREIIGRRLRDAAISAVRIERYANRIRITLRTARPGLVIGRKGEEIDKLRDELVKQTGKEVYLEIQEVKSPDVDAQLVSENIAMHLERRVSFRRAMKRAIQLAMDLGADGIKVLVSGRLNGAELSRSECYKQGKVPLHTLRAPIHYGHAEADTKAGKIGVKVWICKEDEAVQE
ncbi:30S ribosomal protein S3 [Kiritimatiella glycovorans]|uniref:Small ribosomal subunit protein uS3 n=1 Tax=Kiritimatiella glycovorans TaxID=1307763 RepID=A0A0G3EEP7_9BACT|nr:30S ribosomal protein S3 [Kiritimatiella glycovorans]AKJ64951.1 30S ribosomal protein S3 [Kiritimatiella glycovorans]